MIEEFDCFRTQAYIAGQWVDALDGSSFEVLNPVDDSVIAEVANCGSKETEQAITAAHNSLIPWSTKPAKEKARLMRAWFETIVANAETLATLLTLEQGKPLAEARTEINYGASYIEWFSEETKRIYGDVIHSFVSKKKFKGDWAPGFKKIEKSIVRTDILKNKNRIDGRGLSDVRPISCEVGILPRTHGSALFTRGETQAIVTATLGTSDDEQRIESLDGLQRERFMLHYNFPPFSVGETGRIGTGRREIGHGKLAWRAIHSSLPSKESFPYTFRVVSEITESNGSSSMATVCGTSLALMDAGVPIKEPVAGIAMGLIKEGDDFSVLSDILGDEDHLGDMDFKVAGTKDGITSLQMDIKITGITFEIMEQALKQAKDGRIHILGEMNKALNKSRDSVGKHTPKMEKITVDKKDIATVIGKGGATIREIVEKSGAKVDVSDDGTVTVAAPDEDSRNKAMQIIKDLTAKAELNKIYNGKVMKIMEFGAFVNFLGKQDGLVHISELADKRVAKVTDVVKEGDEVKVKVIGFDRGKVKLSIKQAAI